MARTLLTLSHITYTYPQAAEAALRDKKRSGGDISLVFPARRGRCILYRTRVAELEHIFSLGRDA